MNSLNKMIRLPDEYRESLSQKNIKKWNKIIGLFLENRLNDLALNHRSGTRGRILSTLVLELFKIIQIPFKPEPIFYGIKPNGWYTPMATLKSPTRGRVKIPRRQNFNFNLNSYNRQSFFLFHPLFLFLRKPFGGFLQSITFAFEF